MQSAAGGNGAFCQDRYPEGELFVREVGIASKRWHKKHRVIVEEQKGEGVYNVVVIGAGTAGLVTAAGTAGLGGRVALIERNKMGGDCLNFGCVPSKALISSARLVAQIRRAENQGLSTQEPRFVFHQVMKRMRERRAAIAPNDSQQRFESLGVDVFRGEAKFLSPYEVEVGGRKLCARNFVIATGSRATIPKIEGIDAVPYYTNETIFDGLKEKPASMIILGGGPIGCELGQAFSRLRVKITLLQSGPQLLRGEDRDVGEFMQNCFEQEGVEVRLNTKVRRATQNNGTIFLATNNGNVSANALLIAAGRTPNIESLNLETARVNYSNRGVQVNEYMQTSQRHIYAAGDVANRLKFTHTADFTARAVVRNILMPVSSLRQKVSGAVVPWCTYTEPEVAHVGLGERAAAENKIPYDVFIVRLAEVDRAVVENEEDGFAKILTRKGSDQIIGATIVAAGAGELIHEFVVAMNAGVGLGRIAGMIHAYPTLAELARKAGDKYNRTRLTPWVKKMFAWRYRRARRRS
jgi:pyruvate/2-oxoglutarate dehydrogenase complex dihydrolipoamide dehydrogenase (E3) component